MKIISPPNSFFFLLQIPVVRLYRDNLFNIMSFPRIINRLCDHFLSFLVLKVDIYSFRIPRLVYLQYIFLISFHPSDSNF